MVTVADVLAAVERIAPLSTAFEWDRVGLQLGDPNASVQRVVVSLDRSRAAVEHAIESGAHALVTHHPLIWTPLPRIVAGEQGSDEVLSLARAGIAHIAAHTNWDCAVGGVNDVLAGLIGLRDVEPFGSGRSVSSFKLVVFCPHPNSESLIDALAGAGAGASGAYERCAFTGEGTGTFRPLEGARPAYGEVGRIERVDETRIEMLVPAERVGSVEAALRSAHPYEEPAFDWIPLRATIPAPVGRIGSLAAPTPLARFQSGLDRALHTRSWAWGDPDTEVLRIAVVGGAADDEWRSAQQAGADAFVTGEVRQHAGLEASESGIAVLAAGHYATEHPAGRELALRLGEEVPSVDFALYEPRPGFGGRPF